MKYNLFSALVILIIINVNSNSQIISHYGFKAGIAASNLVHSNHPTKYKTGYAFGIFAESNLNKNIKFMPELLFLNKGFIEVTTINNDYGDIPVELNYLSLPLHFKFGKPINNIFSFVSIGPRVDLLIGSKETGLEGIFKEISNVNYGISIGLGTDIFFSDKSVISFNARYSLDANYNKMSGYTRNKIIVNFQDTYKFTGRSFEFLIGFEFK